jgi:nitrate/nitrite transporter NarK
MTTFVVSGIVFAIVGGLCALFVRNPPTAVPVEPAKENGPNLTPPAPDAPRSGPDAGGRVLAYADAKTLASRDFTPMEAARTFQFYALWLMLFLNVTAGILFISNAVPIIRELTGVTPAKAASIYGFLALFNGLGRFFWGAVSDRIGRNWSYVLIYGTQVAIFATVGHFHSIAAVSILFAIVLMDYGGGFGTMPSMTADYFGTRFMGLIYGWILLAWGVGGVVGPIFVARVKDNTSSYSGALPVIAVILLAAIVLPAITRRPMRRDSMAG